MRFVSWRPVAGCSFASVGCANCAALASAAKTEIRHNSSGVVWTGATRLIWAALDEPARMLEPSAVYVCDHGDLFHSSTPDDWIDRVFDQMEALPRHLFLILTKRADRQRAYLAGRYGDGPSPPHLAFGVSAERQPELDARAADLAETAASSLYLTLYPLLGPMDLSAVLPFVKLVVAGEEPQRPADPAWFAAIERQCAVAGVSFARSSLIAEAA